MTSRAVAMDPTDERAERYRRAERAVWRHYGLEPTERFVEFESPAVRLRRLWRRILLVGSTAALPLFLVSLLLISVAYGDAL